MPTPTLLLIDDDAALAELLADFVAEHGYRLAWADRPSTGYAALEAEAPALVLLDVMLPEQDGFAVCRDLRARGVTTPILMLTARGDDLDRIRGLRTGADDYLAKPFNPLELVARVEAILRRTAPVGPPPGRGLDPDRRTLRLDGGREVPLTPGEYKLLDALVHAPGRAFSRDALLALLDEAGATEAFDRAIDIHVSRLRAKLETDPKKPRHLLTVRGLGYRWQW